MNPPRGPSASQPPVRSKQLHSARPSGSFAPAIYYDDRERDGAEVPSRKPFFARRGSVFMYRIRPVPCVRLQSAL